MKKQNYELDDTVSKATDNVKLWRTERGLLEISRDTLAVSIRLDDKRRGYVFHGHGRLLLDSIVETEEGAVGEPVEKELDEPFLMLGDVEDMEQHFSKTSEEDFTKIGYEHQQDFINRAKDLCDNFFIKRVHEHHRFSESNGLIFAFPNEASTFDILVAKGSKLVYKATDITFISNNTKVVLKSQGIAVCKNDGKSVIIKNGRSVIIKK